MGDLLATPELIDDATISPDDGFEFALTDGLHASKVDNYSAENIGLSTRSLRDELMLAGIEVIGTGPRLLLGNLAGAGGKGEGLLAKGAPLGGVWWGGHCA